MAVKLRPVEASSNLEVTDRCETCHVGLKEASLAGVGTQPFRLHPPIPHALTEFGCVMCHRGQGFATTVEDAHQSTLAWEQPILPARYIESSCGQCHEQPLTGTPQLNKGREMLARYGCVHCHKVASPEGRLMTATDAPPPLLHIAEKTTREWVFAWIKNPQAYAATATMPNFQLSDDDARDISAFLFSQSTPYLRFNATGAVRFDPPSGLTGSDGQVSAKVQLGGMFGRYLLVAITRDKTGKAVQVEFPEIALDYQQTLGQELNEKYCSRCHNSESTAEKVSNHDNLSVPPHAFSDGAALNQISRQDMVAIITHGGAALGKSPEMPPYSPTLSTTEIEALTAYIRAVADPPYRPPGVFNANP